MVKYSLFLIIYCHFDLGRDVYGQGACDGESNVLDSCDGRVISNNIFYVDFSLIKYQCSCSFTFAFNARLFYSLSRNPGYDDCGTAIRISDINGTISTMQCTSFIPSTFVSSQMTTVELSCVDSTKCGNAGYCLRIRSNNASINVNGSCQSIPVSMSSSEASITAMRSVPTQTKSGLTHSTQWHINKTDVTPFTLDKGCVFLFAIFFNST